MVKGNQDRRKELAQRQRDDKRGEIERKKGGPELATPSEVRARLLSDLKLTGASDGTLWGWCLPKPAPGESISKSLCASWFRTGSCTFKRCRFSHEHSISHLSGVPAAPEKAADGDDADPKGGSLALPPLECRFLRDCDPGGELVYDRTLRTHVRMPHTLLFIQSGEQLVYDFEHPHVFASYAETHLTSSALAVAARDDRRVGVPAASGAGSTSSKEAVAPDACAQGASTGERSVTFDLA